MSSKNCWIVYWCNNYIYFLELLVSVLFLLLSFLYLKNLINKIWKKKKLKKKKRKKMLKNRSLRLFYLKIFYIRVIVYGNLLCTISQLTCKSLYGVIYKPTISELLRNILWSIKISSVNMFLIELQITLVLRGREQYWRNEARLYCSLTCFLDRYLKSLNIKFSNNLCWTRMRLFTFPIISSLCWPLKDPLKLKAAVILKHM